MILNDTKPPLEEAVALAHYGVPGMKWGRRKARSSDDDYNYDEMAEQERHERNKRIIAGSALAAVGAVATVAILHKTGVVKINPDIITKGKEAALKLRDSSKNERVRGAQGLRGVGEAAKRAQERYKDSGFAKRTFEPRNTGNPLWSRIPKAPDVGFGMGPGSASTMGRGTHRVHTMDDDIWDIPVLELTAGPSKKTGPNRTSWQNPDDYF